MYLCYNSLGRLAQWHGINAHRPGKLLEFGFGAPFWPFAKKCDKTNYKGLQWPRGNSLPHAPDVGRILGAGGFGVCPSGAWAGGPVRGELFWLQYKLVLKLNFSVFFFQPLFYSVIYGMVFF
jgi:hypothetical protein